LISSFAEAEVNLNYLQLLRWLTTVARLWLFNLCPLAKAKGQNLNQGLTSCKPKKLEVN
jgi:hypothetical protein